MSAGSASLSSATGTAPIAISVGEPAGIGPDLCVMLAQSGACDDYVFFADPDVLAQRAEQLQLDLELCEYRGAARDADQDPASARAARIQIVPQRVAKPVRAGQLDAANVPYVMACLDAAIDACQRKECRALVTGPIHKGIINQAGLAFSGHTEYLAQRSHSPQPVMVLQSPQLRVALVTTHLALREVADAINEQRLRSVINVLWTDLKRYLGRSPTIFVSGLNPHAGENGYLGREELDIIEPVLNACRAQGMKLIGPLSADTMFSEENLRQADVFLCMYHDQGLPVLKYQGFGAAVNITLGLPFLRCSVDHGTALPLAGSGNINDGSLRYALETAARLTAAAPNQAAAPIVEKEQGHD